VTQAGRQAGNLPQQKPKFGFETGVIAVTMDGEHLKERPDGTALRAPFPWFGGKRRVADLVWSRLGNVDTYNEPFAGSLAVLLGRPHEPRVETVNDLDCMLANFWRALQHDPEGVAYWCDLPVNEADLHARHRWLVSRGRRLALRCMRDPHAFNVKVAGWWVWGLCLWIGSGWCQRHELRSDGEPRGKMPKSRGRRWQGGGQGGGSGVHAPRLAQQVSMLSCGGSGNGVHRKLPALSQGGNDRSGGQRGALAMPTSEALYDYLGQLAARLRRVRVCCGDWRRVLTPSVTTYIGTCGVFLDPPYAQDLRERCYAEDHDISAEVRAWAIEHGDDPKMRIALCGYEEEHAAFMPASWEMVAWKAHGGYARAARGVANRERERIWFSPHCLRGEQPSLFEASSSEIGDAA
jgi:hypothetical protein